jgi:hypothetical protein
MDERLVPVAEQCSTEEAYDEVCAHAPSLAWTETP